MIGVLPGSDPELSEEVVVVSAHYDHLGRNRDDGCPNSRHRKSIRPGANDNASGTAALVELAFASSARRDEIARTPVFITTDGEECGCAGVKHYVYEDPVLPLSNTVYTLNIDQIGEGGWLVEHEFDRDAEDADDCEIDGEVFARRGIRAETFVGDNANYRDPCDVIEALRFKEALETLERPYDLVWNAATKWRGESRFRPLLA